MITNLDGNAWGVPVTSSTGSGSARHHDAPADGRIRAYRTDIDDGHVSGHGVTRMEARAARMDRRRGKGRRGSVIEPSGLRAATTMAATNKCLARSNKSRTQESAGRLDGLAHALLPSR